MYHYEQVVIR